MRFKLDENLGARTQEIFRELGHDAHTVREERLCGVSDEEIFRACGTEQRCLVTLDLDFTNVFRFPPSSGSGVVVIRLPHSPTLKMLCELVGHFLRALERVPVKGKLWIVEPGRIRIHDSPEPE